MNGSLKKCLLLSPSNAWFSSYDQIYKNVSRHSNSDSSTSVTLILHQIKFEAVPLPIITSQSHSNLSRARTQCSSIKHDMSRRSILWVPERVKNIKMSWKKSFVRHWTQNSIYTPSLSGLPLHKSDDLTFVRFTYNSCYLN